MRGFLPNLIPEKLLNEISHSTFVEFGNEKRDQIFRARREIAENIFNDLQKNPAPYFLIFNDGNSARLAAMKQVLAAKSPQQKFEKGESGEKVFRRKISPEKSFSENLVRENL